MRFRSLLIVGLGALIITGAWLGLSAYAGASDNLSGYAWSSNIGWISFNCTNDGSCSASDYGVNVNAAGQLTGHAWSGNIGWVSFNRAETGSPPSNDPGAGSGPIATFDKASGIVRGWARALAYGDGWDGWISLEGSDYGVTVSGCNWQGWAWGSTVVGWASFSDSGYGVVGTGNACQAPPMLATCFGDPNPAKIDQTVTWSCVVSGGTPPYSYIWTGDDGLSGSAAVITHSYSTEGIKNAFITITDSVGETLNVNAAITVAKGKPGIIEIIP